jgi:S1-C subfamily serine protease
MTNEENTNTIQTLSKGLADAVEVVGPAIVRVHGRRRRSASGLIYSPGMVLTTSHAVEREEDLSVGTEDGNALEASFVGRDHATDLAVLRVGGLEAGPATPAEAAARVGQLALAVGRSARSGGIRASFGVVSAVGGPLRTGRGTRLERYVQTDATPYPGLSGGPLLDVAGEVLGILTAAFGSSVAFAVPADLAWGVASKLEAGGTVERGYLGILSQPVALPGGESGAQRGGLLVVGVEEGSPAGQGGLLLGDIVTALDGVEVEDTEDLLSLLAGERVGKTVGVAIVRGGEPASVEVTVGRRPERQGGRRRGRRG